MRFKIDLNPHFKQALALMEQGDRHVFVTGKAGTGKSTLLQVFRERAKKSLVVLAPTGVAAVNVKGQTIHSFFRFKPDITPASVKDVAVHAKDRETYKKLQ
ncbi:MAG: AAA ATPase, partial [Parcubacteria group bacterium GW2011_GWF2_44_17]